jgi:hypothetical protein
MVLLLRRREHVATNDFAHQVANDPSMSALGHKRTFAAQKGMSALPPKADIDWRPSALSAALLGDKSAIN